MKIVFTAHNRPQYLAESLDSWCGVRGFRDLESRVFLDPSGVDIVTAAAVEAAESRGIPITVNSERYGCQRNPWQALEWAFSDPTTDFVILGEEDIVVSSDILEYFNWAKQAFSPDEALGVCCHTFEDPAVVEDVFLNNFFSVWIWGIWRESWENYIRDTWDFDYSSGNPSGWDCNITHRIVPSSGKGFAQSSISRSRHIGQFGGTHMAPYEFPSSQTTTFQLHREPTQYRRVDR